MKLLTKIGNVLDRINSVLAVISAIILMFLMLSVTYEVSMRYFFGRTTDNIFEIWEYSLIWLGFPGAAWLLKKEGHVRMDVVISRLRPRAQAALNTVTSVFAAMIFFLIAWYGVDVTWNAYQTNYFFPTVLAPPKWPVLAIIPPGSFLFAVQFLRRAYKYRQEWKHHGTVAPSVAAAAATD